MNNVICVGGRKKEREIAHDVVAWCINKMMPRMKTLDIEVEFEKLDVFGYCALGDTNREFTLSIQKGLSLYELVSTICHEMVHVKQYARKELRYVKGATMWKKKSYVNVDYNDAPWEKEAFGLEDKLAAECLRDIKIAI